jgi:hypothetical protein
MESFSRLREKVAARPEEGGWVIALRRRLRRLSLTLTLYRQAGEGIKSFFGGRRDHAHCSGNE